MVESVSNIRNEMPLVRQDVALTSVSLISNNSRLPLPPDSSLLSTSPQEIQRQLEDRKEINETMLKLQDNIMEEIKALRSDMARQHNLEREKIEDLNKWRWIVVGAAGLVAWVVSTFTKSFLGR